MLFWSRQKTVQKEPPRAPYQFSATSHNHPRYDYLFAGSAEALIAALFLKKTQPEKNIGVLYKPTRREIILPIHFSPFSPSFETGPASVLAQAEVSRLWQEIVQRAGRRVETFLIIADMAEALNGRMLAHRHQNIGYLEPLDTRHILPSLRKDGADFCLEGAHVLKDGRLFAADDLASALLETLCAHGVGIFASGSIHFEADTIHLEGGGKLSFDRLVGVDMEEGSLEAETEWFQPVIGLKTPLLNGACLMSEHFTALSMHAGEALFIGRWDEGREELERAILALLPGMEGAHMSRSFFLPLASLPSSGEIGELVAPEQERMAEKALSLGVESFGLKGVSLAAAALQGKSENMDGERVRAWFAGIA